jgi:CTP:phosphocholine cytidylyltransferase-like protein
MIKIYGYINKTDTYLCKVIFYYRHCTKKTKEVFSSGGLNYWLKEAENNKSIRKISITPVTKINGIIN